MLYYERKAKQKGYKLIVGIDEVGRGSLAGPVMSTAVLLKKTRFKNRIDDSKKLTPKLRERSCKEILENSYTTVGIVSEVIIDKINIHQATRLSMEIALENLIKCLVKNKINLKNLYVLVDGNVYLKTSHKFQNIIKGDQKSLSIASASIVAKVMRDRLMCVYDKIYPYYGFGKHKGYGTKEHFCAIKKFGLLPIHRRTFNHA
ncbi:MAG: ribonuclease HII [Candidatus Omnitrophota bacterium]